MAEKIDHISRIPLPEAERLISSIREKGARLAVPGVVDLSDLADLDSHREHFVMPASGTSPALTPEQFLQRPGFRLRDRRDRPRQALPAGRCKNCSGVSAGDAPEACITKCSR